MVYSKTRTHLKNLRDNFWVDMIGNQMQKTVSQYLFSVLSQSCNDCHICRSTASSVSSVRTIIHSLNKIVNHKGEVNFFVDFLLQMLSFLYFTSPSLLQKPVLSVKLIHISILQNHSKYYDTSRKRPSQRKLRQTFGKFLNDMFVTTICIQLSLIIRYIE